MVRFFDLINSNWIDPKRSSGHYTDSVPFPHIIMDEFLTQSALSGLQDGDVEVQSAFGSVEILEYLQILTGKERRLLTDPYSLRDSQFELLKQEPIHTDYSKHLSFNLDRRLNLLLFANSAPEAGRVGVELYGKTESRFIEAKSNRCLIFDTTDFSPHSVVAETGMGSSVRVLNIYFYSCGRPMSELFESVAPVVGDDDGRLPSIKDSAKKLIKQWVPPILFGRKTVETKRVTGRD